RVDRAAAQDHFTRRANLAVLSALPERHADAALAFQQKARRHGSGLDAKIVAPLGFGQKSLRCRSAEAAFASHLRIANAFLHPAIQIGTERKSRLPRCLDEMMCERKYGTVVFDTQRPAFAAVLGVAALHIVFRFTEIRQHVVEAPAAAAHLRPAVEVR